MLGLVFVFFHGSIIGGINMERLGTSVVEAVHKLALVFPSFDVDQTGDILILFHFILLLFLSETFTLSFLLLGFLFLGVFV